MRVSTISLLLFAFAALSLYSGISWLVVVFIALGLAMLFFYKEARAIPAVGHHPKKTGEHQTPHSPQPQQIVVVQEDPGLNKAIAEEIAEHIKLGKLTKKLH